jgi:hypothetical protein
MSRGLREGSFVHGRGWCRLHGDARRGRGQATAPPLSGVASGGRAHPRLRIRVQRDLMQRGDHLVAQECNGAHYLFMRDVPVAADQDALLCC